MQNGILLEVQKLLTLNHWGAVKSLARPGRKQATATENVDFHSGFGGLGVACWPLVPKIAGSNPAEAVGLLRAKKSSARLPSEVK